MRTGTVLSVIAHFGILAACLVLAGVKPFDPVTAEAVIVEIVPANEVPSPSEPSQPAETAEPAEMAAPEAAAESAASTEASKQETPPDPGPDVQQQAAPQPQQSELQQSELQQTEPQQAEPPPQPEVPTAQPDITSRFGMMFTLPQNGAVNDFDAKATAAANIKVEDAAALRAHLKTCATLPRSISPGDNVRIVLRVAFARDGRLAREPLLIEASASEKGPALMKSAVAALEQCQPYAMLPADRYNEWRMLDLSFTPKDFRNG
jgi:outer membrane biosynthesis protein TonB